MEVQRSEVEAGAILADRQLGSAMKLLKATGYPALTDIQCRHCNGAIILVGKVPSYYQKQIAQAVLLADSAFEQVENLLEVTEADTSLDSRPRDRDREVYFGWRSERERT